MSEQASPEALDALAELEAIAAQRQPRRRRDFWRGLRGSGPVRNVTSAFATLNDAQVALIRVDTFLATLPDEIIRRMELLMATDRDTSRRVLAVLPVVLAAVRGALADSAAKDARIRELEGRVTELTGEAASDEALDTAELEPIERVVSELAQLVIPAANADSEVTPVPVLEDASGVLAGEVDPGAGDDDEVPADVEQAATAEPGVSSDNG